MSKAIPIMFLGLGLVVAGAFWMLMDTSRVYLSDYVINDDYWLLMELGWDVMPTIVLLCGVFCLIAAGISSTRDRSSGGEF